MKTSHPEFAVHFLLTFSVISMITAKHSPCDRTCPGGPSLYHLPFPFGFSDGCQIQLNCSKKGEIFIGEFRVQNVTSDNFLLGMGPNCNRSISSLSPLHNRNFALTSRNVLLLQYCTFPPQGCIIPEALLESQFDFRDCSRPYCFSSQNEENGSNFMSYAKVNQSSCKYLYSSMLSLKSNFSVAVLGFNELELGWWLEGTCRCSSNADCTKVISPFNQQQGYKCRCSQGYEGDGYVAGSGCWKVPPPQKRIPEKKVKIGIGAGVGGCLITASILVFVIFRFRKIPSWKNGNSKNNNAQNLEFFFKNNESFAPKRFRYMEVNKMTNSFKEKLGEGGYGSVFKGQLQDGRVVAVKILLDKHKSTSSNGEEFLNEVASISRTSHVNIVTLLGFCYEKDKRALLYEFMPNGSLDKFIYNKNISLESSLEWKILYEIAIGIARGLGYLHRGCSTRIIHFDIKPHNILLDEDFSPKIADIGLAKLCPGKESIISMLDARGTAGYIAPEIFNRNFGEVSHKSDVYSYGMMILEMVGGRKNFDVKVGKDHSSQLYFPDWIYDRLNLEEGLGLRGIMIEESEKVVAKKMIIVGLWCIQMNPSSRPSMSKVLEMLEGSLEVLQIPPKPFLYSPPRSWPSATGSSSLIEIK